MRVFLGFGYGSAEQWVPDLIIPTLESLDITVLEGRELRGRDIEDEVRHRIATSDAVIGFLLRRKRTPDGKWTTSDYVRQEIEIGHAAGKDVIQVVETGVAAPGGFLSRLQRLPYDRRQRDAFLVRFTKHIRDWVTGAVYVRLAPEALIHALDVMGDARLLCDYEILSDGHIERRARTPVLGLGGGLYVKLAGFRPGCHANLWLDADGLRWSCRGVPHMQPFVTMQLTAAPSGSSSTTAPSS